MWHGLSTVTAITQSSSERAIWKISGNYNKLLSIILYKQLIFITFKIFDVVFVVLLVTLTCFIHLRNVWIFNASFKKSAFCLVQGVAFVYFFYAPWSDLLAPPWDIRRPFERRKWQMPGKEGTGMLAIDWAKITNWETSIPPVIQRGSKLYLAWY